MRHLLHIMHFGPSGTRTFDHFILAQARHLRASGWDVKYAFAAEPPLEFRADLLAAGASYVVIPFPFRWVSLRQLVRALGGYRPDVTLTSFLSSFCRPLLAFKLLGYTRRLVVMDHSSGAAPLRTGWRRLLTRWRGRLAGAVVDAIVPVSYAIARRDVERVFLPQEKIAVIHNGIRVDQFAAPDRPARDHVEIAFAGQLIPEKGAATLLRAVAAAGVLSKVPLTLSIAGQGPQEAELRSLAAELELSNVRFLGHIDSIPALFGAADIVVVPSEWYEAFGLTIAEAMACRAACIVSDAGACPEVVGDAGLIFPAGNHQLLAERIVSLAENRDLRLALGNAARSRAEAMFNLADRVANIDAVCETVLVGRPLSTNIYAPVEALAECR